jgi:TonB-linked SusC/RagA family outer membrane protein
MKVSFSFIFIGIFELFAIPTIGQNAIIKLEPGISTMGTFISEVESQTPYMVIFSSSEVNPKNEIYISSAFGTVSGYLDHIIKGTDIRYVFEKDYIILTKKSIEYNQRQGIAISGVVKQITGESMPGVTVVIKGTSTGTVTDSEGRFDITAPNSDAILVFSYIGYINKEITVGNQSQINVTLTEDTQQLEEVIVVGYGTQKKVNLTGSVESVSSVDFGKRTVTQASNLLQGKASGISVRQTSGNPAGNSASLLVRGKGTFSGAGTEPLVLVDGIESSINAVNPSDIESISILKDAASSAIYGSKAANGVILVTTKKGSSGRLFVSYNGMVGKGEPTFLPEMVNSWEYAEIVNEAMTNVGQQRRYTDEEIQNFRSGTDLINYPNFDHIGHLFGSGSAVETKHDLSMQGGNETTQFLFSLGYYDQQGLIKKNDGNRYNVRLNVNSKLRKNLNLSVKLSGQKLENNQPHGYGGLGWIVQGAMRNANTIPGLMPDGYYGRNEVYHPEADLDSKSFVKYKDNFVYGNGDLVWEIIENLKVTGQAGYTFGIAETRTFLATYPVTETYGVNMNTLNNSWAKSNRLTLQAIADYNKTFGNHFFHLLGGISSQSYFYNDISAFRNQFPNNEITQINAGSAAQATNGGTASSNKLASYFGRMNYNYMEKYLFEANFRYDGSSRFPAKNRWGLFPSASAAWRISEEGFFKDNISFFNNLKLRFSWGKLGNQSIGDYPYQSILSTGRNYVFANAITSGVAVTTIPNTEITWETTTITDIGADIGFLDNRFAFTFDYYKKVTSDILYNVSVSRLLGATPSSTNAGEVQNTGFDANLSYRNTIGDFSFGISGVFSMVHNKVTKIANLDYDINAGLFVGHPIGSNYGYISNGLFADENDVNNSPSQPFTVIANPGGIKLVDINGLDGVPDGKVDSYDRDVIGQPLPITSYGLTINGEYKNFDFDLFFQGEGGRQAMVDMEYFFALNNNGNVQRDYFDNRWTAQNPNPHAIYPKILITSTLFYNNNRIDYWYRNATFLRFKNAQIGYTLPQKLSNKISLSKARIYLTGENLFTITKYFKGWDPEMNASGSFYPLVRLYAVGINLEF